MNRRDAIKNMIGGLGVIALGGNLVLPKVAFAADVPFSEIYKQGTNTAPKTSRAGMNQKYNYIETEEPTNFRGVDINYRNPGGVMSGNKEFNPAYIIYVTTEGDEVYLNNESPSVGFNPKRESGFKVRASVGKGNGEMNLTFTKGYYMGGFYREYPHLTDMTIKEDREAVRVSITEGEMRCLQMPNWELHQPVLVFEGTGKVNTGNIGIRIKDGRFASDPQTRAISPLTYGATPMTVRAPKERNEVVIKRDGSYEWRRNAAL
jgi:hypothetical protein